jgi:hypothetical protein
MATQTQIDRERRTRWSFAYDPDNTWYWQAKRANGALEQSEVKLETLADALTDAMQHGYVAWSKAAERRRTQEDVLNE